MNTKPNFEACSELFESIWTWEAFDLEDSLRKLVRPGSLRDREIFNEFVKELRDEKHIRFNLGLSVLGWTCEEWEAELARRVFETDEARVA